MKIDDIRRSYVKDQLDLDKLDADPFVQFERWLQDAIAAELPDPTAMCVATVDAQGQPSQRLVLLVQLVLCFTRTSAVAKRQNLPAIRKFVYIFRGIH